MIEANITRMDGTTATIYAANFPELFSKMAYEQIYAVDACTIDFQQMRQGKERNKGVRRYETPEGDAPQLAKGYGPLETR